MNLWDLGTNEVAEIDVITSHSSTDKPSTDKSSSELLSIGLRPQLKIKCLSKTCFGGPRIYSIDGKVCSLCSEAAQKIKIHKV